jgi:hypothetical protein
VSWGRKDALFSRHIHVGGDDDPRLLQSGEFVEPLDRIERRKEK